MARSVSVGPPADALDELAERSFFLGGFHGQKLDRLEPDILETEWRALGQTNVLRERRQRIDDELMVRNLPHGFELQPIHRKAETKLHGDRVRLLVEAIHALLESVDRGDYVSSLVDERASELLFVDEAGLDHGFTDTASACHEIDGELQAFFRDAACFYKALAEPLAFRRARGEDDETAVEVNRAHDRARGRFERAAELVGVHALQNFPGAPHARESRHWASERRQEVLQFVRHQGS